MAHTTLGIFDNPYQARRAMEALRASSLKLDDISLISRAAESGAEEAYHNDVSAGEGATLGAVWGGLVGLAALLIPGVGPFIALGALGAALTGAVAGAVVGGISAALIDFSGIPAEHARQYEQQVHEGKTLVAVKSSESDALEVRRILAHTGAESLRDNQTDITHASFASVRVAMYDDDGQAVNEAAEYGEPINPTTVRHDGNTVTMPEIEPSGNGMTSTVEDSTSSSALFGAGRVGQVEPRGDMNGEADMLRPETLGAAEGTHAQDVKKS